MISRGMSPYPCLNPSMCPKTRKNLQLGRQSLRLCVRLTGLLRNDHTLRHCTTIRKTVRFFLLLRWIWSCALASGTFVVDLDRNPSENVRPWVTSHQMMPGRPVADATADPLVKEIGTDHWGIRGARLYIWKTFDFDVTNSVLPSLSQDFPVVVYQLHYLICLQ